MGEAWAAEVAMVEASHLAFYRAACANMPECELAEDRESFTVLTGLPLAIANVVGRVDWGPTRSPEETRARIAATLARFKARGVPALWLVWPSTRPAGLGEALVAYGLARGGDQPGMALELAAWSADVFPMAGARIRQVTDADLLETWMASMVTGFGFPEDMRAGMRTLCAGMGYAPPFSHYLAYLDDAPVATATLLCADGVAGIYNVATLPEARGRGIGSAITAAALRVGRELGCHTAILSASTMGEPVYRRLGFAECCRLESYIWQSGNTPD